MNAESSGAGVPVSDLARGDIITYWVEDEHRRRWQAEAEVWSNSGAGLIGPTVRPVGVEHSTRWEVPEGKIVSVRRMTPLGPVALTVVAG